MTKHRLGEDAALISRDNANGVFASSPVTDMGS